uniref:Myosin motor domain-containing protein n=1 Tax=Glossina brevipalpis TaxID=37001 RepID=A0A1A9WZS8_9MUSC
MYRFGKTQRAGQVGYWKQVRANFGKHYITIIQSAIRRYICRRSFLRLQHIALMLAPIWPPQKAQEIREQRAAVIIGKHVRGWLVRRRYKRLRHSICDIQQYSRGMRL